MSLKEDTISRYPVTSYKEGTVLLLKGDTPTDIYLIEQGLVEVYSITPSGSKRQVSVHGRGEDLPIGYSTGLAKQVEYFYEVYSRECTIRRIPRLKFLQILRSDNELLYRLYAQQESQLRMLLAHINALEHSHAQDKVAFMLMAMAEKFKIRFRPYGPSLNLTVTQQEIANQTGLTRETTSSELKKLEFKKLISHTRKSYVLYLEKLKKYLEDR